MTLEQVVLHMVQIFERYSGSGCKSGELEQSELKKLVKDEFPALSEVAKDDALFTAVMKVMDLDITKRVTYKEYACFLACLSVELESFIDMDSRSLNMENLSLEQVAVHMVRTFKKHSGADGKRGRLDQRELAKLVMEEYPTLSVGDRDDKVLATVLQMINLDSGQNITYKEYAMFLACLSMELEAYLQYERAQADLKSE